MLERPTQFPSTPGELHVATFFYDVEEDGGELGHHVLPGKLPTGAIVSHSISVRHVSLDNATVAADTVVQVGVGAAPDTSFGLVEVSDINNGNWDRHTDLGLVTFDSNPKSPIRDVDVVFVTVDGTEPLIAGRFEFQIFYTMKSSIQ